MKFIRKALDDISFFDLSPAAVMEELRENLSVALGYDVTEADPAYIVGCALLPMVMQGRAISDAVLKSQLPTMAAGAALDRLGARYGLTRRTEAAPGEFVVCIDTQPENYIDLIGGSVKERHGAGKVYDLKPGRYNTETQYNGFDWVKIPVTTPGILENIDYETITIITDAGDISNSCRNAFIGSFGAAPEDDNDFAARIYEYIRAQNKPFSFDWWRWFGRTHNAGMSCTLDMFGGAKYRSLGGNPTNETQPVTVAVLTDAVRAGDAMRTGQFVDQIYDLIEIDKKKWKDYLALYFPIPQIFDVVYISAFGLLPTWPDGYNKMHWTSEYERFSVELRIIRSGVNGEEVEKVEAEIMNRWMKYLFEKTTKTGDLITEQEISKAINDDIIKVCDVSITPSPYSNADAPGIDDEYYSRIEYIRSQQCYYVKNFTDMTITWAV